MMIQGGIKYNILPPKAKAAVNIHLIPGGSVGETIFLRTTNNFEHVYSYNGEIGSTPRSPHHELCGTSNHALRQTTGTLSHPLFLMLYKISVEA